ncbi:hypothetical protein DFH08DRAFT_698348, partial [Mycena albidolilacea]
QISFTAIVPSGQMLVRRQCPGYSMTFNSCQGILRCQALGTVIQEFYSVQEKERLQM